MRVVVPKGPSGLKPHILNCVCASIKNADAEGAADVMLVFTSTTASQRSLIKQTPIITWPLLPRPTCFHVSVPGLQGLRGPIRALHLARMFCVIITFAKAVSGSRRGFRGKNRVEIKDLGCIYSIIIAQGPHKYGTWYKCVCIEVSYRVCFCEESHVPAL